MYYPLFNAPCCWPPLMTYTTFIYTDLVVVSVPPIKVLSGYSVGQSVTYSADRQTISFFYFNWKIGLFHNNLHKTK